MLFPNILQSSDHSRDFPVSNQSTDFLNSWLIANYTAAPGSFSPRSNAGTTRKHQHPAEGTDPILTDDCSRADCVPSPHGLLTPSGPVVRYSQWRDPRSRKISLKRCLHSRFVAG